MIKKIKDLTISECKKICNENDCEKCPLAIPICESNGMVFQFVDLDNEVELDD